MFKKLPEGRSKPAGNAVVVIVAAATERVAAVATVTGTVNPNGGGVHAAVVGAM
jgi:hypothetical protein